MHVEEAWGGGMYMYLYKLNRQLLGSLLCGCDVTYNVVALACTLQRLHLVHVALWYTVQT